MSASEQQVAVRAVGRGLEAVSAPPAEPGPEHKRLGAFIGRWINEGQMLGMEPAPKIVTSDVYEWMPGGFFVLHTAYGKVGSFGAGATEIIGWDADTRRYRCWLFDSAGNASQHDLNYNDGKWMWQGDTTRCTATFSDDGRIQTANHERTDDGETWVPSMHVVLTRID